MTRGWGFCATRGILLVDDAYVGVGEEKLRGRGCGVLAYIRVYGYLPAGSMYLLYTEYIHPLEKPGVGPTVYSPSHVFTP